MLPGPIQVLDRPGSPCCPPCHVHARQNYHPDSSRKAVQLVESVRQGKTVRRTIVRHIGTALDADELTRLKDLAEVVKAKLEAEACHRNCSPPRTWPSRLSPPGVGGTMHP